QIDELGYRERGVLNGDARRALTDVNQPRFVAIDERPQQHATHHAEHSRVGADAQRQGYDDGQRQPLGVTERANRKFQVADEAHSTHGPLSWSAGWSSALRPKRRARLPESFKKVQLPGGSKSNVTNRTRFQFPTIQPSSRRTIRLPYAA